VKLRELARLVDDVGWNCAAPEILRSGDEIRLDLNPVGDLHRAVHHERVRLQDSTLHLQTGLATHREGRLMTV
jgi:hypothetical protein